MGFFDSHAHYYDGRFASETEGADVLLPLLFENEVEAVVNIGTSLENDTICLEMAQRYERMYAAVGLHPTDIVGYERDALDKFEDLLMAHGDFKKEKIVAIGEIGYDYHWEPYDKEHQRYFFEGQMKLAEKYDLPVVIHDREAHGDCMDTVRKFPNVPGIFHSYSGSAEMAKELVARGWYISFSGVISFKNAERVRAVAASVPKDRLLIETDCPYLAPHPMRGKINHSGYLKYTAEALGGAIGLTTEETAMLTAENARRIFRLA